LPLFLVEFHHELIHILLELIDVHVIHREELLHSLSDELERVSLKNIHRSNRLEVRKDILLNNSSIVSIGHGTEDVFQDGLLLEENMGEPRRLRILLGDGDRLDLSESLKENSQILLDLFIWHHTKIVHIPHKEDLAGVLRVRVVEMFLQIDVVTGRLFMCGRG
jgi:hypothetical protein